MLWLSLLSKHYTSTVCRIPMLLVRGTGRGVKRGVTHPGPFAPGERVTSVSFSGPHPLSCFPAPSLVCTMSPWLGWHSWESHILPPLKDLEFLLMVKSPWHFGLSPSPPVDLLSWGFFPLQPPWAGDPEVSSLPSHSFPGRLPSPWKSNIPSMPMTSKSIYLVLALLLANQCMFPKHLFTHLLIIHWELALLQHCVEHRGPMVPSSYEPCSQGERRQRYTNNYTKCNDHCVKARKKVHSAMKVHSKGIWYNLEGGWGLHQEIGLQAKVWKTKKS